MLRQRTYLIRKSDEDVLKAEMSDKSGINFADALSVKYVTTELE